MKSVLLFLVAGVLVIPGFKVFGQEAQAPVYKKEVAIQVSEQNYKLCLK
jgi:hypothetical protein